MKKKSAKNPTAKSETQADIEAAERRHLIAEAAERRRAGRIAEEAEADRRRTPVRTKGEDDEILAASAGSSIDDALD